MQGVVIQGNAGGLAFYQEPGLVLVVVHQDIKALVQFPQFDLFLNSDQCSRVFFRLQQLLYKMLPHPLFGGQGHPFFADDIKNLLPSLRPAQAEPVIWIFQLDHILIGS